MAGKSRKFELGRQDLRVLEALQRDGHMSDAALGDEVGLSESAANRHRHRLEEAGYIERYAAVVDFKRLGFAEIVFVDVILHTQDHDAMKAFEQALVLIEEVVVCHALAGDVDFLLQVAARDGDDFERVRDRVAQLPGVKHAYSRFVLHKVVERSRPLAS